VARATRLGSFLALVLAAMLVGCGGYEIRGKVVHGPMSLVSFVAGSDERLQERGLAGATVTLRRDPTKGWAKDVATAIADGQGEFVLHVGEFGAGWMTEQWMIRAARKGFERAETITTLPGGSEGRRLLIQMTPGESGRSDDSWESDDLMKQYEQYR
jgi:hypothetical protein